MEWRRLALRHDVFEEEERTVGVFEAFVWLTDIAELSRDDATELMRWSARALLQSALADNATHTRARQEPL